MKILKKTKENDQKQDADLRGFDDQASTPQKRSASPTLSSVDSTQHKPSLYWWQTWWILPFLPILGAAEGIDLGERILVPFLKNQSSLPQWEIQVLCTPTTAVLGFLAGLLMYFILKNYVNPREGRHHFLSTPGIVALLTFSLVGAPIAAECLPVLLTNFSILQDYSAGIFLAMVFLAGFLALIPTAGKCYYNQRCGGKFTFFFEPATPNIPTANVQTAISYSSSNHSQTK